MGLPLQRFAFVVLTLSVMMHRVESKTATTGLGIPGTTNTINGYDTELGGDPICWKSESYSEDQNGTKVAFPNDLIQNFNLGGEVELLEECPPNSVNLTVHVPEVFNTKKFEPGFRPRAGTFYNFRVTGSVQAASFGAKHFVSDGGSQLVAQIILCRLDATGFCSPFVHEQSNARDAANNVTKKPSQGDLHGGTHVHSKKEFVALPDCATSDCEDVHLFNVDVPFIVNTPGSFFVIAALQFFVGTSSEYVIEGVPLTRYDVATAASERVISFEEPAEIRDVMKGVVTFVNGVTGLSCLVILFLLEETIRHRKNQIMKLSQGPFLVVLLLAALVATACVWMMNPTISDLMCTIYPPLIAIPLQLIYAIIIGRVWRTQRVLSPLLQEFYVTPISTAFGQMIGFLACAGKQTNSLKATVTNRQLATAVFSLTLPQIIIQVLALVLQPSRIEIVYTDDASIGRQQCVTDAPQLLSLVDFGFYLIIVMNILLMIVAQASKRLPSLFNELEMISGMSWTSFVVLLIGVTILIVTGSPTTPPDVTFVIWVMVILSITLNSSIRLLYPKLRMVWNGETVLVSKLVTDHKKTLTSKKSSTNGGRTSDTQHSLSSSFRQKVMRGVTGFSFRHNKAYEQPQQEKRTQHSLLSSGNELISETERDIETPLGNDSLLENDLALFGNDSNGSILDDSLAIITIEESVTFSKRPGQANHGLRHPMQSIQEDNIQTHTHHTSSDPLVSSTRRSNSHTSKVVVTDHVTPSRTLIVPMVKLQEKLITINARVTSGLGVSHEEWEDLRLMTSKLGDKFSTDVEFEWERRSR